MVSSVANRVCVHGKDISISLMKFTELEVMKYVGASKVIGEKYACPTQEIWLVEEIIRLLVRSMVKQLNKYHDEGCCITNFGDTNLMVTGSGHAYFTGVACLKKTDDLVKQNYTDLHHVVLKTVFRNYRGEILADWRRLLGLMRKNPNRYAYLFGDYAALVPIRERILFFLEAYEHVKHRLDVTNKQARQRILDRLPYKMTWSDMLKGNYLLEESFSFKTYDTSGNPEIFLDFYWNTIIHRMDRYCKIKGGYTAEEFEMILLVRYPLYLPVLQEALYQENELRCLQPHTIFCLDANVPRGLSVVFIDILAEPKEEEAEFFMVGEVRIPVDMSELHKAEERLLSRFSGIEDATGQQAV